MSTDEPGYDTIYKGARRASPKAPSRRRRYVYRPPGAGHWAMTLQLSTVAPLEAIARLCNSVAGQAQTARRLQWAETSKC